MASRASESSGRSVCFLYQNLLTHAGSQGPRHQSRSTLLLTRSEFNRRMAWILVKRSAYSLRRTFGTQSGGSSEGADGQRRAMHTRTLGFLPFPKGLWLEGRGEGWACERARWDLRLRSDVWNEHTPDSFQNGRPVRPQSPRVGSTQPSLRQRSAGLCWWSGTGALDRRGACGHQLRAGWTRHEAVEWLRAHGYWLAGWLASPGRQRPRCLPTRHSESPDTVNTGDWCWVEHTPLGRGGDGNQTTLPPKQRTGCRGRFG